MSLGARVVFLVACVVLVGLIYLSFTEGNGRD